VGSILAPLRGFPYLTGTYRYARWSKSCSGSLQLGILLHQLLQAEARELYRNLGFFAFSFAQVDRAFAIFRVTDFLAGAESALAGRLFDGRFRNGKLLAAAGEELGDVLDGVVGAGRGCGLLPGGRTNASVAT
jgi:hypothetical protein